MNIEIECWYDEKKYGMIGMMNIFHLKEGKIDVLSELENEWEAITNGNL